MSGITIGPWGVAGIDGANPISVSLSAGTAKSSATQTRSSGTTAYEANDVVGQHTTPAVMTFANVVPNAGQQGFITGVRLRRDIAAVISGMTTWTLHLYNAAPTAIADGTAWALADADRDKYEGSISLVALVDVGGTLWSQNDNLNVNFKCAPGSTSLYGMLVTVGPWTPAASEVTTVSIYAVPV